MKINDVKKNTFEFTHYDYLLWVVIDGMDVSSVKSILKDLDHFRENYVNTIGVEIMTKTLQLFDPRKNKEITVKTPILVMSKDKHFSKMKPYVYRGCLILFFIKENNVSSVEDFQAIIKDLPNNPLVKILDTPKDFTYELFESTIKEYIESYEE